MRRPQTVFFGELLLRLDTRGFERFVQAREFTTSYTGAEANVAVAMAQWGLDTHLVSAVPANEIGDACVNAFRAYGVGTEGILRCGSRLGLFYLETGSAQRASKVVYDRAHSAFSELVPGCIPWDEWFAGKDWFHLSGTSPALTRNGADLAVEACERAQACGLKVSMDVNYRASLWRWDAPQSPGRLAGQTLRRILPHVNLLIANWGQAQDVFGMRVAEADGTEPGPERQPEIARRLAAESDRIERVALTMRESLSASRNRFGAMLYDRASDTCRYAPEAADGTYCPYDLDAIVDRVGSGDGFAAGLLRGLLLEQDLQTTLAFAVAVACLKHTVPKDFALVSVAEAEALMRGDGKGRIVR
jgi:2-dehydro-3-deoxygluconokinase